MDNQKILIRTTDGKEYKFCLDAEVFQRILSDLTDESKTIIRICGNFFSKYTITLFKIMGSSDDYITYNNK